MKTESENLPELQEAFEAVKGQLFGPLNAALVRHKHQEILQDAKEKRVQALDPHGRLSLAGDDPAERDRKDRDSQTRTLTWLLANDRSYREAHERAMLSFTNAGNAIDRAIEAGEKAHKTVRQQIEAYLASTARLKDGRYVLMNRDGTYRDENGNPLSGAEVAEVEGQTIRSGEPFDEMTDWKNSVERDLADLRGWSVEVGDMKNRATDDKNALGREELPAMTERADDLAERAKRYQQQTDDALARWSREVPMPETQEHTVRQERTSNLDIPTM